VRLAAVQAAPAAAAIAERRDITIVFVDLTDFTRLSTELDAEELHAIVRSYTARVEATVRAFGGVVERYLGDAVMAIFGAPVAHGDDGLRAVRAALTIREQVMPALSVEFRRQQRAAIGIASGEVLSISGQTGHPAGFAVVGEPVNLAARIENLAEGGEILISHPVYEAVQGRIRCEFIGERAVKGIPGLLKIHRVLGVAKEGGARRGPLIGRDAETALLREAVLHCAEHGQGSTLYIRGDPGIGKTRLLEQLESLAHANELDAYAAAYLDFGLEQALSGIPAVLASLLGVDASASQEARHAALTRALQAGSIRDDELGFAEDALHLPQSSASRSLLDAMDAASRAAALRAFVTRLFAQCAERRRFIVAIEDVHWAKPSDVELLHALAQTAREAPFVLAMSSRMEGDPLGDRLCAVAETAAVRVVDLRPLSVPAARLIARDFRGADDALLASCVAQAEGNPLFLEQLLVHVAETGSREVPGTVRNVVLARLDRLDPADRRAAQTAAVIGQRFGLRLLRRLLRDDAYDLTHLVTSGLVRAVGEDFLFSHALVHEGTYASLLHSAARELHREAADYYAAVDRVLRAQHLDRAADARAAAAYREAAAEEADAYRFGRALELVTRGLELSRTAPERVELRLLEGRALHDAGEVQSSLQAYQKALDEGSDDAQRCRAWIGLAAVMRVTDDFDGAFHALRRAESLARSDTLRRERAEIYYLRGSLHFPRGELEQCLRAHGQALELARLAGSPYDEARAMSGLGDAHYARGRMRTAYDHFAACIALCTQHGFGRIEASNLFMVATVRIYLNQLDQALQDALRSIEIAHRVGHQRAEIVSRLTAGWICLMQGRPDAAEEQVDAGLAVVEALGARRFRAFLLESVARIRLARGDARGAQAAIAEALEIARAVDVMRFIGPWLLSTAALASGDAARSRAALDEGLALLDAGCVGHNYYWFYKHAMETCLDHGALEGVEGYARRLEAYTESEPTPWSALFIRRARVLAATAASAASPALLEEARALLQEARDTGHTEAQARLEAAATR
jgi:class 3 adenylate cyclase/tetratricopeptide (TPR) repeat protein